MFKFIGVAAALAAMTGAAHATTFNLTSYSGVSSIPGGYSMTVDGITMNVTAGVFNYAGAVTPGGANAQPQIYSGAGLGVWTNYDYQHTIDGSGYHEVAILSFDQDVILDSVSFGYFDFLDDFDFFADTNNDNALDHIASDVSIPNSGTYTFASMWLGDLFGIGADDASDSFKLKSISVSKAPEVPLPAALPLFVAGLAGLGFARGARKTKRC